MRPDDNEFRRSASSALMPAAMAILFALAGLLGNQVLSKLTTLETTVELLKIDVAVIKTDIQYMKRQQEVANRE